MVNPSGGGSRVFASKARGAKVGRAWSNKAAAEATGQRINKQLPSSSSSSSSGQGNLMMRRGVLSRGVASTLALVTVGSYLGFSTWGRRREIAVAATEGGSGKTSSLGFDLSMSKEEINDAIKDLSELSVKVTMNAGTERAFTGKTVNGYSHDNKEDGVYVSAVGGLPLFDSKAKFNSGTGWPSFFAPIAPDHVREIKDTSIFFMPRTEIVDAKSGAHLGHVFDDGPAPTGLRYCMNAAALKFIPRAEYEATYKKQ